MGGSTGCVAEEESKEQRMRKLASTGKAARTPRKGGKRGWLRPVISRMGEKEFLSLLLGHGRAPSLLLASKGQLPSPAALYESKFPVPPKPS